MPQIATAEGIPIYFEDDFYGDPWKARSAETVILVHGVSESSLAWYAWVPRLGTEFRVIRPDLPGYGQSRIADDVDYSWDTVRLASDLKQLLDALDLKSVHMVGAKYGGSIAAQFAIDFPERLKSLSIVGGPISMRDRSKGIDLSQYGADIEELGVRGWADRSMRNRLGSSASADHLAWWTDYMGSADKRPTIACSHAAGQLDLASAFAKVRVPSLFVTTKGSPLLPIDDYASVISTFPHARLITLDTDGYHPAATHAAEAAEAVRTHILDHLTER